MIAHASRGSRLATRPAVALLTLFATACGGGGDGGGGSDTESTGGSDTNGGVQGCGSAFPIVPLGYESLGWPSSTPFDADVLAVESELALKAGESGELGGGALRVYQALSFQNATCDGDCGSGLSLR